MHCLEIFPEDTRIMDTDFIRRAREKFRNELLMSYVIPSEGVIGVGLWNSRDKGHFTEFFTYEVGEVPTSDHMDTIEFNLSPVMKAKMLKKYLQAQKDKFKAAVLRRQEAQKVLRDITERARRRLSGVARENPLLNSRKIGLGLTGNALKLSRS